MPILVLQSKSLDHKELRLTMGRFPPSPLAPAFRVGHVAARFLDWPQQRARSQKSRRRSVAEGPPADRLPDRRRVRLP